jgi:hypothetical protein
MMAITSASGRPEFEIAIADFGRLLCAMNHPLAVWLGATPPLVPCCRCCTVYPQHPTAETLPG